MSEPSAGEVRELLVAFNQGRLADSERLARALIQRYPASGFCWKALGEILCQQGRTGDALVPLEQAVLALPGDADAHCNLGVVLITQGRLGDAERHFRRALQIKPDFDLVLSNLAGILKDMGRLDDAEACCRKALGINIRNLQAHCNLGGVMVERGRWADAETCFRNALRINAGSALAHGNLGSVLRELGRLDEAERSCREALRIDPALAEAHANLGVTLEDLGRLAQARECLQRAIDLKPVFSGAHSNYLYCLNYSDIDVATRMRAARRYGAAMTARAGQPLCPPPASPRSGQAAPSPLRVGFVSGDVRNHPVGYFLESLLANLDRSQFTLFGYPTTPHEDALTARVRPHFAGWKPIFGMTDEAAARAIHADGVHVLFDLSGHTAQNRLPVFAWGPAPVQVSWLGYFATTGLEQMDYVLADPWCLPPEQEANFTERAWRLPRSRLCFTVPDITIPVAELPAAGQGYVTFACFNRLAKINDRVLAVWARVLQGVPHSRLFLKTRQLEDTAARRSVIEQFATHGIAADRLIIEGHAPRKDYLAAYNRADICLDPFPFSGATTSAESLWMGVPVLTLAGSSLVSRQGVSLLTNAGLEDWIAADEEDYVRLAIAKAGQPADLAFLRSSLRQRLVSSPLCDAGQFAADFADAVRGMWADGAPLRRADQTASKA